VARISVSLNVLSDGFLGAAPRWYKLAVLLALVLNPVLFFTFGAYFTGWVLLAEFLGVLAMALACYPLAPGGLLAIEAVLLGLSTPAAVYNETVKNFPVLLLLMFMVAGIYFLRDLIATAFLALIGMLDKRIWLALTFLVAAAVMSAFLDALTVMAVLITVSYGLYQALALRLEQLPDEDREGFKRWLGSLVMHAAIGTALGGVITLVGEPQNLIIGKALGWNFGEFFLHMAPVSLPVLGGGILVCLLLERFHWFGFGVELPPSVRRALGEMRAAEPPPDSGVRVRRWAQGVIAVLLVLSLAFHVAEIGLVGLAVIVLGGAFAGAYEEHDYAPAFEEALPFAALLVVFFAIVSVIESQHLFTPITHAVLAVRAPLLAPVFYLVNGLLSAVSDNVFVASIFLGQAEAALREGLISPLTFQHMAVAINAGTNIPSISTPNGQAAFLFLLSSPLAPLLRLSYGRMLWMALPYALVLTLIGLGAVWLLG